MTDILGNRSLSISLAKTRLDTLAISAGGSTSAVRAHQLSTTVFALQRGLPGRAWGSGSLRSTTSDIAGRENWLDLLTGDEVDVADLFGAFA